MRLFNIFMSEFLILLRRLMRSLIRLVMNWLLYNRDWRWMDEVGDMFVL